MYKLDASNHVVNALSWAHDSEAPTAIGQLFLLSYPTSSNIGVLEDELTHDQYDKQIIDEFQINPGNWSQWKLVGKLLLFQGTLYFLAKLTLIPKIFHEYQSSLQSGHADIRCITQRICS